MEAGDIMHPEDAKAIQVLKRIKGFDDLVRVSMEYGFEKIFRGENLGEMVKVNARNYPSLYSAFRNVVRKVGIKEPELYIYNDPVSLTSPSYLVRNRTLGPPLENHPETPPSSRR